jgi:hypothetical protein
LNTNNIKSFAKQARLLLMEGVKQRLTYWGFDENGNTTVEVKSTVGGYEFRGDLFTDEGVPSKWNKLKAKLTNKQAIQDVIEEAAYTWFNRIMAIKILEKRGYLQPTLEYVTDLKTPHLVQEAKRGQHQLKQQKYVNLLQEYLLEDKEEQALGLLLSRLCNNNILLHDVFGRINDYTEILLPNNLLARNGIIDLINSDALENEQYQEVELIGWLYQFYISDKKDEVFKGFKANKKARPEDIPAATQIFTPKWIVKYMVENTVGKIYLDYDATSSLKPEMRYLVDSHCDEGRNHITTNQTITPLISNLEQLTLIDPAAGSGHILVTGFELLFKMYREQGYTAKNAVQSILQNNLFGLDIDDRAMQLSRFAVLLKAAEFHPEILKENTNNTIVLPHIYSFPESHDFQLEELQSFLTAQGSCYVNELRAALQLLNEGKNIGAALKLELIADAYFFITKQYQDWHHQFQAGTLDIMQAGLWQNLQPFIAVLLVMTKKYTAVVANPPYMGQKSMNNTLKNYINIHYPETKSDLMTVFMEVIPNMTQHNSRFALINLPSWLFLSSFEKLRESYIKNYHFESLLHMGRGIFGIDFGSVAFAMKKEQKENATGNYFRLHERNFQHILFTDIEKLFLYANGNTNYKYDFNQYRGEEGVTEIPEKGTQTGQRVYYPTIPQENFEKITGSPIGYWVSNKLINIICKAENLNDKFKIGSGLSTSDNERFLRYHWEVSISNIANSFPIDYSKKWFQIQKGGDFRKWYGNLLHVVNWANDGAEIKHWVTHNPKDPKTTHWSRRIFNTNLYFKAGISWSVISAGAISFRYIEQESMISNAAGGIFGFNNQNELQTLLTILNSKLNVKIFSILNPTINYSAGVIQKSPYLSELHNSNFDFIGFATKDWNYHEISLNFKHSYLINESFSLKSAYSKWEQIAHKDFFQLHADEETLNRIVIDIYDLHEELTPEVALKDITILQEELDRNQLEKLEPLFREQGSNAIVLPIKRNEVISQFLSYCIGLFMGRYRLDKPGLHIAHPNPTEEELNVRVSYQGLMVNEEELTINNSQLIIDEDAIIPLMSSECAFPDDALVRIKNLIHDLWGEDNLTENSNFINECLGIDLDKWLTDKFWGYHTSMYKKKPIYWLFTSNPKKPQQAAFKVLVYMHRMDKYIVSKIQRNYLHPHQEWIKKEIENLVANEVNLSKIELKRLEKLRSWDIECRDYNEVLKALALKEITFDLDDGVSVNYEKFEGAVAKI